MLRNHLETESTVCYSPDFSERVRMSGRQAGWLQGDRLVYGVNKSVVPSPLQYFYGNNIDKNSETKNFFFKLCLKTRRTKVKKHEKRPGATE